ncbi:MAG TPA: zf-HC2 domain-containing protein [Casimicrobiaceae bacterium]|jgi:anti-sigma factor RsiW
MNCHEATALIAAHADGELDALQRHAVQKHLQGCDGCTAAHQGILALRARLRDEVPYHTAPAALRARVLAATRPARRAPPRRWQWLSLGALAGCAATILGFFVVTAVMEHRVLDDLAVEAVSAHVRATLGQHTIEVASSDQHTVKPWLSARLDYSPPVPLMQGSGFVLTGGRLDYLDKQRVAVLVYRYRDHVVDVFVRPSTARAPAVPLRTLRGFNVTHARGADMDWVAVSDVNAETLLAFVRALAQEAK